MLYGAVPAPYMIFPDFFKERRVLGKRESDDQRSMDFRNVVQIGTPEITTKMTVKKIGNIQFL